ncbi:hypothetical protein GCM10027295_34990 [Pseudaeromonas pectinilytica]|jgi:hypothetical protein
MGEQKIEWLVAYRSPRWMLYLQTREPSLTIAYVMKKIGNSVEQHAGMLK